MKKQLKSLLLIVCLLSMTIPSWGQASTEGKEFWVGLLMANSPSGFSGSSFNPFIAISAKKQCQVVVSNPSQNWTQPVRTVQADSWLIIDDIPNDKWYDDTWTASNASETKRNLGIKVEATEDVSVYAAIRMEYSYDATNVLPTTALGSEYIIQDYPVYNSEGEAHPALVIVATENNTTLEIVPSSPTQKNKPAGSTITVNLDKGETYQVVGKDKQTFSGTRIIAYATGNKSLARKIAVFSGADFTQVPGGKSARDCLYEQAMPLEYWGTQFVVTRSVEKDANRVRITAQSNGTKITIDGIKLSQTLQAGETYEFEMSENLASTEMASAIGKASRTVPSILTGEAHYIETSCPCAVFCYDVSSDYRFSSTTKLGDPSMVWISPLQQRISKITFGACGTSGTTGHTNKHYVNIVCLTADTATVLLSSDQRAKIATPFTPVPGNPTYSYARVFLVDTDGKNPDKVYTLTSKSGVVAHVYGSGFNESYAYSVGSAAVKHSINVNGVLFSDGYRSDEKFCISDAIEFDASIGTDAIQRVDWDFGDGTSEYFGPVKTTHQYNHPGWYDVTATLFGHQVCTDDPDVELGSVSFTFRIVRPDTVIAGATHSCISVDGKRPDGTPLSEAEIAELLANGGNDTITKGDCSDVQLWLVQYGRDTEHSYAQTVKDSAYMFGKWYYASQTVKGTLTNASGCDSLITCDLTVITSLNMQVPRGGYHICPGEELAIEYLKTKGDIQNPVHFVVPGLLNEEVTFSNDNMLDGKMKTQTLPTQKLKTPGVYVGELQVIDANAQETLTFPIDFTVNYPSDVFKYKFNNVLAVYNPGFGGNEGWSFTGYQWYCNNVAIPNAIGAVYHSEEEFKVGDTYYVELTANGVTIPSCEQTINDVPSYTSSAAPAPAKKTIVNQHMVISKDGKNYDIYGQRIE